MASLARAKAALKAAGYDLKDQDDGQVTIRYTAPSGRNVSCGRIWQDGDRIGGRLTNRSAKISIVLGDEGLRLDGHLAKLYGKRQLPTLGFVRLESDGRWWAASGVGQRTLEHGWFATFAEAAQALYDDGCLALVPLKGDQVGWDGVGILLRHLEDIGKVKGGRRA